MVEELGIAISFTEGKEQDVLHHRVWESPAPLVMAFVPALLAGLGSGCGLLGSSMSPLFLSDSGTLDVFERNAPSPDEKMVSAISVKRPNKTQVIVTPVKQHKTKLCPSYWLAAAAEQHHSAPRAWAQQHCVPGACSAVTKREERLV